MADCHKECRHPPGVDCCSSLNCSRNTTRRHDRGRFQFDLARSIEQVGDKNHAHGRVMRAHEVAPDATKLAPVGQIGGLVGAIGGQAANVLGSGAGFCEHGEDVFKSLLELGDEFVALKPLCRVPSHLARDEYDAAGRRLNAIGITDRRCPSGGK